MTIIISGISLKNHWTLTRNEHGEWTATLVDPEVADTGVILSGTYNVDTLIEKCEIFEKGEANYRANLVGDK